MFDGQSAKAILKEKKARKRISARIIIISSCIVVSFYLVLHSTLEKPNMQEGICFFSAPSLNFAIRIFSPTFQKKRKHLARKLDGIRLKIITAKYG